MANSAGGDGLLDGVDIIVETHAEVRVVPADDRPAKALEQEAQILFEDFEFQRLVVNGRIDAEAACIRTAETAKHGHDLEKGSFLEDRLDEGPAFADSG